MIWTNHWPPILTGRYNISFEIQCFPCQRISTNLLWMASITSSGIDTEFNLCHSLEAESKFITRVLPPRYNPSAKGFHFSSLIAMSSCIPCQFCLKNSLSFPTYVSSTFNPLLFHVKSSRLSILLFQLPIHSPWVLVKFSLEFDAFRYMLSQQESRSKSESEIINVSNRLHVQIHLLSFHRKKED